MKIQRFLPKALVLPVLGSLLALNAHAAIVTWTNSASGLWSTNRSWSPNTQPGSVDDVVFFDRGSTNIAGVINNTVDTNYTLKSLQYGNTNNFHATSINTGRTLTISGTDLTVGTETDNGSNQTVAAAITGPGALVVSNAAANVIVRQGCVTANAIQTQRATLDLSGLNSFSFTGSNVLVGVFDGTTARPAGTLYLAKTNSIRALAADATLWAGIDVGDVSTASANSSSYSFLYLGQTNAVFVDSVLIGGAKSRGQLNFNPVFTNHPVAYFRGTNGGTNRVTTWGVGDNGAIVSVTGSQTWGTNDFSGGVVDARIGTMYVGRGMNAIGPTATGASTGVVTYAEGIIDVNTLEIGYQSVPTTNAFPTYVGIFEVGSNATLVANNSLRLAFMQGGTNAAKGTLNIEGGTVMASTIVAGGGNSTIVMTNGTLIVTNTIGTPASPLGSFFTTNSTWQFSLTGITTNLVVTNLITGGVTNRINIASLPALSTFPTQFTLVKYSTAIAGAGFNFGLGTTPSAYASYISNRTANTSISLVVVGPAPTKLVVTSVNGGSSPSAGANFNVIVQAQDAGGTARVVASDTPVTLSLNTGSGTLGGTLTGTINGGANSVTITGVTYTRAESGVVLTATRTAGAALTAGNSSPFTVTVGAFAKLQLLMPGETAAPGTVSGKTNSPSGATVGTALNVTVNAVDANWNLVGTNDTIRINSTDPAAILPANAALSVGTRAFSVTFLSAGTWTVTASNVTHSSITSNTGTPITVNAGAQTITFPSPGNQTYGVAPLTLNGTASSGLSVSYSVTSGPATVSVNTLTITGSGSVTIQASQAGNSNWNAASPVSQIISIAQKTLTPGITASNRIYDATTNATIASRTVTGVVGTDVVNLTGGTASFSSKTVGNNKTVTAIGLSLTGANATNYALSSTSATTTANITAKTLTVSAVGVNKIYDGTNSATVTLSDDRVAGDVLSASYGSAAFADQNVGTGKTVNVSAISVTGTDSANYSFNTTAVTTANITALSLTVTANNTNRIYGAANPAFTAVLSGFMGADNSGVVQGTPAFSTPAVPGSPVGTYAITPSLGSLSATNYSFGVFSNGTLTIAKTLSTNIVISSVNPVVPGSNLTFMATISAIAPGGGTASGTVNFRIDGSIRGSGALIAGAAAFTTNGLPVGTHTVIAEYAGDTNFFGATNSMAQTQSINTPPVAGSDTIQRFPTGTVKVRLTTLLANDSDADGDALGISVSSTSAQAMPILVSGAWVYYQPAPGFTNADSFAYTITDGRGGSASGTVTVAIKINTDASPNLSITAVGGGSVRIDGNGIPAYTYRMQFSTNVGPFNWQNLPGGSVTADSQGRFQFIDSPGVQVRYYRSVYP